MNEFKDNIRKQTGIKIWTRKYQVVCAFSASAATFGLRSESAACAVAPGETAVAGVLKAEVEGGSIAKRSSDGGHASSIRTKRLAPLSRARFDTVSRSCWQ